MRLLAQLTRQVAVVQYPTLSRSTVRHVELVALSPTRLLLVLILSTGRVEQRVVELAERARRRRPRRPAHRGSTGPSIGERIADAAEQLADAARRRSSRRRAPGRPCSSPALVEAMSDHRSDERVAVGGTANLARFGDGFDATIRPMLEALEEHVVLLKLLGEATSPATRDGADRPRGPLRGAVVDLASSPPATAPATRRWPRSASSARPAWTTPATMASVRAVAQYLSKILDEG